MNDPTEQAASNAQPLATSSETITFKRSHFYMALAPLMFVCGLASGYMLWGARSASALEEGPEAVGERDAVEAVTQIAPEKPQRVLVSPDDDPYHGPENAPVTIIEFSDFECPYCAHFYRDTLVPLLEIFPEHVRFVYRDFR